MLAATVRRRATLRGLVDVARASPSPVRRAAHFLAGVPLRRRGYENEDLKADDQLKDKLTVLYFSAGWCGSCRLLSPKVKKFYEAVSSEGVEVVWVSRDREAAHLEEYYEKALPACLYIPFGDKAIKELLARYEIKTIPAVRLVDNATGAVLDAEARGRIEQNYNTNPSIVVAAWKRIIAGGK